MPPITNSTSRASGYLPASASAADTCSLLSAASLPTVTGEEGQPPDVDSLVLPPGARPMLTSATPGICFSSRVPAPTQWSQFMPLPGKVRVPRAAWFPSWFGTSGWRILLRSMPFAALSQGRGHARHARAH